MLTKTTVVITSYKYKSNLHAVHLKLISEVRQLFLNKMGEKHSISLKLKTKRVYAKNWQSLKKDSLETDTMAVGS